MEPIKGFRTVSGVAVICLVIALLVGCATTPEDENEPNIPVTAGDQDDNHPPSACGQGYLQC